MKKLFFTLITMLALSAQMNAMSFEQARQEALFLTDKMAYELNLTDEQYEAAYEINLDYLMGVTGRDNVYGTYWERRNLDLSYILLDWQWNAYLAANYFYRPLYWDAGFWHFGIYARYPHRGYFYFGRPHFYATYRGGHAWHRIGGRGYYYDRRDHYRTPHSNGHIGMHDRLQRGDYRGANRHSSTRITGPRGSQNRNVQRENRSLQRENRSMQRENRSLQRENRSLQRENRSMQRENRSLQRENRSAQGSSTMRSSSSPRSQSSNTSGRSNSYGSSSSHSGMSRNGASMNRSGSSTSHNGGSQGGGSRNGGRR